MAQMNMQQMMRQAQKMQAKLEQVQEGLKDVEVSSTAGGGMVKVVATADNVIRSIEISPEAVDPDDVELLQDMILAAVNDALASAQDVASKQMGAVTGNMRIPGLF